jgi:exosome complex component RRP4
VERVNKLITVRPLKARYMPEVGDVVVGRITEVAANRWRVDINARSDAHLFLSGVNLPGGVLVRFSLSPLLRHLHSLTLSHLLFFCNLSFPHL